MLKVPKGVILHGSRSGILARVGHAEFVSTSDWAANPSNELGWNATIGDDEISVHLPATAWGWNARAASSNYLALEFAQPLESVPISDGQVRAAAWYIRQAKLTWPTLPDHWPTHAELDGNETGAYDGKTDVFLKGSTRTGELRKRLAARLQLAA